MDGSWTIAELAELAAGTLAAGDERQRAPHANGRVRDVPNERLIRWYVTVGLVDPPLSRRGRVAWYGPRHLLQLVAIKRRQAEGRSLAEIQTELAGATNASLAAVARVPDGLLATRTEVFAGQPGAAAPAPATGTAARATRAPAPAVRLGRAPGRLATGATVAGASGADARFWAQRPEPPAPAPARPRPSGDDSQQTARTDSVGDTSWDRPRLVPGVQLAPRVTLLLEGADRQPGEADLAVIAAAAGPLLQALASLGLRPADLSASLTATSPGSSPGDPDAPERSRT